MIRLSHAFGVSTLTISWRTRRRKREDRAMAEVYAREPDATGAQAAWLARSGWWTLPIDDKIPTCELNEVPTV